MRALIIAGNIAAGLTLVTTSCAGTGDSGMERARARHYSVRYTETVRVTSDPSGAAIYVDDVFAGNAPLDAEIVLDPLKVLWPWKFGSGHEGSLLVEEEHDPVVIEAVVRDHHTVRKALDISGGGALRGVLAEYQGKPETGSGEATTSVPRTLGATSDLHLTLRPLRGPAAGEPARPRTGGPAAAGVDSSGASVHAATGGVVRVTDDDDDAEVWVDGKFMGNVPAILRLASGDHEIEIRPSSGTPYQRTVTVTPGGEQTLRAPKK